MGAGWERDEDPGLGGFRLPGRLTPPRAGDRLSAVALAGIVAVGLALRVWLNVRSQWMIDGDEALFGIGTVRLLHGDPPNLLFGVPYMGMFQSYVAAPFVALFGPSAVALRCVTLLAGIAFIITTWLLARAWYGTAVAAVAALLAAVPSVYFDAVGLKVWGSYLGVMVLGELLLLGAWRCRRQGGDMRREQWLLLGLICGLALWANLLVVYYALTALALLPWGHLRRWIGRAVAFGLPGVLIGGAPLWWYNVRHQGATVQWLLAGAGTSTTNKGAVAHVLFTSLLPRVLGLTSPWGSIPRVLAAALAALSAAGLLLAVHDALLQVRSRHAARGKAPAEAAPLLLFLAVVLAVYLLSGFGGPSLSPFDGSGRYLLPLWTALPLLLAALVVRLAAFWRPLGVLAITILLVANLAGHGNSRADLVFQSPYWDRLPATSQPLLVWLQANDIHDVWLNHWAGDQVMFLSDGAIRSADYYDIVVGHGIDRFPVAFQQVEEAPRAAFVIVAGSLPPSGMATRLQALGVTYREATVGPYQVYLPLSRRVDPSEVLDALRYPY
jgi:hypothetical protein